MKKSTQLKCIFAFFPFLCTAQIGIGTITPHPSAILDITSSNKGLLIPRVNLTDVNNLTSPINTPAEGLMVWNTNNGTIGGSGKGFYFYTGTGVGWAPVNANSSNTLNQAYDFSGPGLGRTIIANSNPVHIGGEDGLMVSGTFGSGNTLDPVYGATYNSRMFFYPKKAAFRAGYDSFFEPDPSIINEGAWDTDAEIGDYSFATGRYNRASGEASFAANNDNEASGQYATAFGSQNISFGKASFTLGTSNNAIGENALAGGSNTVANGLSSFAFGSSTIADAYAETVIGSFNNNLYDDAHTADPLNFQVSDRAFSVGIGGGNASRKNGFEVFKNGKIRINERYYLPTSDGPADYILATDGSGNTYWATPQSNQNITSNTLYSENTALNFSHVVLTDLIGVQSAIFPGAIASNGNIQVKLNVLCASANIPDDFLLIANDGTTDTVITLNTPSIVSFGTNIIYTTGWANWNADETKYYKLRIQGKGANIDVSNIYILTKAQ
jgi:hypothetical protein